MPKQRVLIVMDQALVCEAARNASAREAVIAASREPYWLCILDRLDAGNEPGRRILEKVWEKALDRLGKALRDTPSSDWSKLPSRDFSERFTEWAKGIADDAATEYLIRALQRNEGWAWGVLRKRYVDPRVRNRVPSADEDDLVSEVILRLIPAVRNWEFRLPSRPGG